MLLRRWSVVLRGSPAHAGIDPLLGHELVNIAGFPRTRGDRPLLGAAVSAPAPVPPHTRG